jgi:hypothetical protein
MPNVNRDGIVTPDEESPRDPDIWSAIMADSISSGIGERLARQEERVSLRATTPVPFTVTDGYLRVPLKITTVPVRAPNPDYSAGNHADGIDISGDVATIVTPGMYTIYAQATLTPTESGQTHSWDFWCQVNGQAIGLPAYGTTTVNSWVQGFCADTRVLAAGDDIECIVGVGTDHIGTIAVQDVLLTVVMQYALEE